MFKVTASKSDSGLPLFISVSHSDLATREEADAITALFPKSLQARTTRCGHVGVDAPDTFYTTLRVNLQPTAGNDKNEGGIKRYRAFRRVAAKHNLPVNFVTHNPAGYLTEEELEAAIA